MGNRDRFRKKKSESATAITTKKKFTAPTSGLEDVYFTWGAVRDAVRYAEVVGKLKEYVAAHFQDQATVAARAMEELKAPDFMKLVRPVRICWAGEGQTLETKRKCNTGATKENKPKIEDW